ncbi:MAG: sarcosine oxidase subunit delta [Gemmatimonadetes bacterium]|nr:sarcosine oxidase subunit delta [Gemmatimonadota bacterium]
MTFRLTCPVCGKRDVYEFTFGGQERGPRPEQEGLSAEEHFRWVQFRMIPGGPGAAEDEGHGAGGQAGGQTGEQTRGQARLQQEWWYHGRGCGVWFRTTRDPVTNREVEGHDGES